MHLLCSSVLSRDSATLQPKEFLLPKTCDTKNGNAARYSLYAKYRFLFSVPRLSSEGTVVKNQASHRRACLPLAQTRHGLDDALPSSRHPLSGKDQGRQLVSRSLGARRSSVAGLSPQDSTACGQRTSIGV